MRLAVIFAVMLLIVPFVSARELSRESMEVVSERETPAVQPTAVESVVRTTGTGQETSIRITPITSAQRQQIPSVQGITQEMINTQNARLAVLKQNSLVTLTCPEPARHVVTMPKMPVPDGSDDCALIGKSAEIEAYLKSLEAVAAECNARRDASYKTALAAKQKLDKQIDQLLPVPPNLPKKFYTPPICSESEPSVIGASPSGMVPDAQYYTNWLKRVGGDVKEYCGIIDTKFISGIANACKVMNKEIPCIMDYYEGVQDTDKTAFHARLNGDLNALNALYAYTDFFYKKTIVEYGIGNLRKYYNESNLDCWPDRNPKTTGLYMKYDAKKVSAGQARQLSEARTLNSAVKPEGNIVQMFFRKLISVFKR